MSATDQLQGAVTLAVAGSAFLYASLWLLATVGAAWHEAMMLVCHAC